MPLTESVTGDNAAPEPNPLQEFIRRQGLVVLDGGLATSLEDCGHDLNDALWSARLLIESPNAIRDMHRDFLTAGADCIATATYQASFPGFAGRGLDEEESIRLMALATGLAVEARDSFWAEAPNRAGRLRPLVAASIGPYGAYLADGSEYHGDYAVSDTELYDFHYRRWQLLAGGDADLLACETIPSAREAEVLLHLLRKTPDRWAWLSFSCRDGAHLSDGTPLVEMAKICAGQPNLAAIGINCTAPEHLPELIAAARSATNKPVLVYPNRGERYDAATKSWGEEPEVADWLDSARQWMRLGVGGVGGCCRIGPEMIGRLRQLIAGRTGTV
jgi:homocysteine S-methyltransferase